MGTKVKDIKNFRTTVTQNTAEIIFNVADATVNPVIDFEERNIDGDSLEIWTGAGSTGTRLTVETDYTLLSLNERASMLTTRSIYNRISIINATYQGVNLYIPAGTLDSYGDVSDATDVNRLQAQINEILDEVEVDGVITQDAVLGETITSLKSVYYGDDGKLHISSKLDLLTAFSAGITLIGGILDDPTRIQKSGILGGFTGLVEGTIYYVGDAGEPVTKGSIADGEQTTQLGTAVSTTEIDIQIGVPKMPQYTVQDPIAAIRYFSDNADRTAEGYHIFATNNALSIANYPVAYAKILEKYNALHVLAGDTDLAGSSTLFYPTPPPTDDGWLKVYENLSNTTQTLSQTVPNGTHKLRISDGSSTYTAIIKIEDQVAAFYGSWAADQRITYQAGAWNTNLAGFGVQRIEYLVPETMSKSGAYGYVKVENVTPSGATISALTYDTGWLSRTDWTDIEDVITHNLNASLDELIISFFIDRSNGAGTDIVRVGNHTSTGPETNTSAGIQYESIDTNSFHIQTGASGVTILSATGIVTYVTTSAYAYKVVVIKPNLVTTTFDVSALPKTYDLTSANVTAMLPSGTGAPIRRVIRWENGGTYKLTLATPDSATINGLTAGTWLGEGEGEIVLSHDGVSDWIVESYVDYGGSSIVSGYWKKYIDGELRQWGENRTALNIPSNSSLGKTIGLPLNMYNTDYIFNGSARPITSQDFYGMTYSDDSSKTVSGFVLTFRNGATAQDINYFKWLASGRWRA